MDGPSDMLAMGVYLRGVLVLLFLLFLTWGGAFLLRHSPWGRRLLQASVAARRLQVVEMAALDTKRRLVLVRRDRREHLLLIGGPGDLVIERDISTPVAEDGPAAEEETSS